MNMRLFMKKAFTLMELLVVISIIALLMSILVPSLARVKYQAKRLVCMTHMKDQATAQFTFAAEHDGKFANHDTASPYYVYHDANPSKQQLYHQMKPYIPDLMILVCPLQKHIASLGGPLKVLEDPWALPSGYCGWGWERDYNSNPVMGVFSGYAWFANFQVYSSGLNKAFPPVFNFERDGERVNEKPWPRNMEQCSSLSAFVAHPIYAYGHLGAPEFYRDWGHGGQNMNLVSGGSMDYRNEQDSQDNPVVYSDGHAEVSQKKDLQPRAWVPNSGELYYY